MRIISNLMTVSHFFVFIITFFIFHMESAAIQKTDAQQSGEPATVEQAANLLDSWRGQGEILDQAKKILDRIIEKDPENYEAYKELARFYLMDGYLHSVNVSDGHGVYSIEKYKPGVMEKAEKNLKRALQIKPDYADAYIALAHLYIQKRERKNAAEALKKAEELGSESPWLHINRARILTAEGKTEEAAKRYRIVLDKGTDNKKALADAYGYLIKYHANRKEYGKVSEIYKRIFEIEPTNAWARGNYADFLSTELGRYDEAIEYAVEALKIMSYGMGRQILATSLYGKWADLIVSKKVPEKQAQEYYDEAFHLFDDLDNVMVYRGSHVTGKALVQALMSKGVSIDAKVEDGSTALIVASNAGRIDAVRMLIELGADLNAKADNGWTPLLGAADEGYKDIVMLLLEKGADIKQTIDGKDAAELADRRRNKELADIIRQYVSNMKTD